MENRNGKIQFLSFIAKRSRGIMARFIIENKIKKLSELKSMNIQGYQYHADLSTGNKWVFVR
jgi:cytoplasmic iron level regulating protein YaaA (DUF328/UPF0246 family)